LQNHHALVKTRPSKPDEHERRRSTGNAKRVAPAPPPLPHAQRQASSLRRGASNVVGAATAPRDDQVCPICLTNAKDLAFGCGHMVSNVQIQTFYVLSIATIIVTMQMQLTEGNKMKKNKPLFSFLFSCCVLCEQQCCRECGESLTRCPICRQPIRSKLRLYSG
jgi:E3 ubiquitin-protein ligase RGLG